MKDKEGKGASGSQARIFPAIRSIGKSVLSPLLKSLRGKTKVNGSAQHLPGAREETRNRSEDIKWLLKLGDENSLDMDRLAPSILDSAVFFGRAEAAILWLINERGIMYFKGSTGLDEAARSVVPDFLKPDDNFVIESVVGGEIIERTQTCDMESLDMPAIHGGFQYAASVPLKSKESIVGCLTLFKREKAAMSESMKTLMRLFASHAAATINIAGLYAALQEKTEKYQLLVENQTDVIVKISPTGTFLFASPSFCEVFGRKEKELIGSPFELFVEENDRGRTREALGAATIPPHTGYLENRVMTTEGFRVFAWTFKGIPDAHKQVVGIAGVGRDITENERSKEALAAEKERLAVTLRSIGDGVMTTDTEGRIFLMNKVAGELTGWDHDDALGRVITEVFNIEGIRGAGLSDQANGGEKEDAKCALLKSLDGKNTRLIEYKRAPIREKNGKITGKVLVFSDITERRKSEEERLKWQKLESIGVLAGGIAHDFNNILTAIIGNISIAKLLATNEKVRERLEKAEKASNRAKDLTRQLLTFSKGGGPVKKTVSIGELVKENVDFAVRGAGVRCQYLMPEGIWQVEVDDGQISQVVQNLIINANQAMPMGGAITVRAENLTVSSTGVLPVKPGRYVKISVSDTGAGIPEDILPRIFDPYFTTKQHGSGLGLATAYSIMKRHGGYINAESRPASGTTFYLYLPASDKKSEEKTTRDNTRPERRRVLVLDDDEMVREVAAKMLVSLGYEAELCQDGAQAVEAYRRAFTKGNPFDAVIVDLTIPGGMGGKQCMEQLRQINPDVVAIVSSGYSDDQILFNYRDFFFKGMVSKPYRIEEFSKVLRKTIG